MSKKISDFYLPKKGLSYLLFLFISFIIFFPILNKGFVSDDYVVLYRIIYKKQLLEKGFFRPLSDISLYISYLISGIKPFFFNITNVFLHGTCCFLIYIFCSLADFVEPKRRRFFAFAAAFLFMVYPYHNEAVVWAIGRGIILSALFGLLSLLIILFDISNAKKYFLSYIFYFIALCGYETVLFLPIIIMVLNYKKRNLSKNLLLWYAGYFVVIGINLLIRQLIAGAVLGTYEKNRLVGSDFRGDAILKVLGRTLLPPSPNSIWLSVSFLTVAFIIVSISVWLLKKRKPLSGHYIKLSAIVLISLIVPAIFGISTNTFEGDRVLYWASVFLCIWLAYLLCMLESIYKIVACTGFALYFLSFFYFNLSSWIAGDKQVKRIIESAVNISKKKTPAYFINMPEELNGTPVFRRGFEEALIMNKGDTARLQLVNYLSTRKFAELRKRIEPFRVGDSLFIPPYSCLVGDILLARKNYTDSTIHKINVSEGGSIYYWDGSNFMLVGR